MTEPGGGGDFTWALLESAPDAMLVIDAEGKIVFANAQVEAVFGHRPAELQGSSLERLVPERFRGRHAEHMARYLSAPERRLMDRGVEILGLRCDGEEFPIEIALSPVPLAQGVGVIAAIRDISARRQVEQRLEVAEAAAHVTRAQLDALLDCAPAFILAVDEQGTIQFVNSVLAHHTKQAVVGSHWRQYLPTSQHEAVQAALHAVIQTGATQTIETSASGPGPAVRWFSSRMGPMFHEGRIVGAVLVSQEVTEFKHMQEQLMVSDRLASVGTLAAGVAHEINNPLAAVLGNLELAVLQARALAGRPGAGDFVELHEELRDARAAAERVQQTVRDLRLFSRTPEQEPHGPVDVTSVLESTLRMVWNEIRHRAKLVREYGDVPAVEATESRLAQVFLNLIVNAVQAIPQGNAEGNEIRVSTSRAPNGRVQVEIRDTGSGIEPEGLAQLFTPFFTTKPREIGTGLGLSICRRLITALGGEIEVASQVGVGTTFRVLLRVASHTLPEALAESSPPQRATRRGSILVIDDEPMIGSLVRRSLAGEHQVTVSERARDAIELLLSGQRFDVILCDLMMPQWNGIDFFESVLAQVPEQATRIIFLSGGAFTLQARAFLDKVPNLCIEKPFRSRELQAVVNARVG